MGGVIEAPNPYVYSIVVVCEKGRPFPRYFEYIPEEPGEHKLTIRLYDAWRNLVGEGETLLVAKAAKEPAKCTTMLCMGDSLTDGYEITYFMKELDLAYQAWCLEDGYKDFMEYINLSGQFDWEYNMPSEMRRVNSRSTILERVDWNGVHPSMDGYMQMADAIYRNFICSFCSE